MNALTTKTRFGVASMFALVAAFFAPMANAALDVSSLTTDITAQESNIETLGLAILGVLVILAGIALLRRVIH